MSGGNYDRVDAGEAMGRWPANVCLDEAAATLLDAEVGPVRSGIAVQRNGGGGKIFGGLKPNDRAQGIKPDAGYSDSGGPSRFFYCSKVSTKEREFGCDALSRKSAGECTERDDGSEGLASPRAGAGRPGGARNHHPTLKPIALTRWLASLIKPPTENATLLVPYSGAGSEMIGALHAGWPLVFGIENDADYVRIAHARLSAWREGTP
jgi:site-specific DNA-methyltransferase (adenine-specific)